MEVIKKLDNGINSILSTLIKEPTLIRGAIHLLLMLYAARIAPKLPDAVLALFENQYFKLFVFSLILWTAQFSPSTSILIAIAFMVSVNYANQKPLWEFMDGEIQLLEEETEAPMTMGPETTTFAPETLTLAPETTAAIEAVVTLANAAVSTTAVPAEQVIPVAEVAAAAVTTPVGLQAIQVLAEQAVTPTPAPTPEVQRAVDLAVESITAAPQEPTPAPAPTPAPVAPKVTVPEPAPTTTASPQVQEAGCYPLRRYDMSKVSPQSGIQYGFESYQEFTA